MARRTRLFASGIASPAVRVVGRYFSKDIRNNLLHLRNIPTTFGFRMSNKKAEQSERVEKMLAGVRSAGLKLTPQRMAIVKELASDDSHPTAQEIFERLRPG